MSRTEHHFGRGSVICQNHKGFKSKYNEAIKNYGLKPTENELDLEDEYINDNRFIYIKRFDIMLLLEGIEDECGHCEIVGTPSDFVYVASYYNGGASLKEVFESMIKEAFPDLIEE